MEIYAVFQWLEKEKEWMFITAYSDFDELNQYLFENEHDLFEIVKTKIDEPCYRPNN